MRSRSLLVLAAALLGVRAAGAQVVVDLPAAAPLPTAAVPTALELDPGSGQQLFETAGLSPLNAAPAAAQPTELEKFLADFHKDLKREHPDMYRKKLEMAAQDDFRFSRVFPQLVYQKLKESAEAARLASAPEIFLDGDVHVDNTQIEQDKGRRAVQFNDFDDSGRGPSAIDVARMLINSALASPQDKRDEAVSAARAAYAKSLGQPFADWTKSLQAEPAVAKAKPRDRDWPKHAGKPIKDETMAASLRAAAGLDDKWKVFDRMGAGGSSIGVRRYMFVHPERGHVFELKELRGPAIAYFTGRAPAEPDRDRLAEAYRELRQVPADVRTLRHDGADWGLRRREAEETGLAEDHPVSAARSVAGALGQAHRGQAPAAKLKAAAGAATDALVASTTAQIAAWRAELLEILKR
jgi:hypothetical protein